MYSIECCKCGIIFGVSQERNNRLLDTHETFYCPSGHPQSYVGKTEAQKLKEQL